MGKTKTEGKMLNNFKRKYLWSSEDFNQWVKNQSKMLEEQGIDIPPSQITHKLFHDIIKPTNLTFMPPQLKKRGRGKLPKQLRF